ncbi:NACHT and ankyrin domain-containing protein [Plectosphaerella plurivora]|uniref:NACHT and ankyrin domain-containing protein n=1 Tax=Plectosphaerella plurivora TaxID=936078 RepID=A0A9P8VNW0_9PEZI|nr:NACHT and ankyrin domain-containing protein [Plectosphaerella plurivora]
MDPASIIGVVAAAAQFASTVRKLAHLIKEVHAGTEPGPTKRRLIQLETWAEVADKIRDSGEQNDPQTEKIMKQCIPTVEALTNQLGRIQISEGDGRREKTRKALLAHWEKDDIADLFAQLHRDQMTLLTYRSFASEGHFLQKIKDSMGSLLDERLQYSKRDNQSTLESDFLGAIFITDPRDDRSALVHRKTARAEGTCAWITKTDEFLDWMSTTASSPGLMIEGGPGKGKSMIAISLTEFLENLAQTSEAGTESVIYFFCDNRNPRQNNALAVIRCLVWQLCRLRPCLSHYGIKELEARGDAKHLLDSPTAAVETLWRIFISMIADDRAGIVSYVIDGLDECDETSILSVLTKFHELSRGHQALRSKFRFIILSRPLSSRRRALALDIPKVCLDLDLNERDITAFIEQRIDELSRANPRKPWRDSLVKKVKTTLLEKAGGTFLWVGFVTDDLRGKQVFEVKQCLRALPQGLNGIYDRILLNMPRIHRSKIRSLLHWICLAEHPLLKIKLAGLIYDESADDDGASDATSSVASDLGSNATSDTAADTDELEGLLEYCKPLIKIAEDSSVHFVHQSARDYFMRTDRIETPDLDYFIVGNLQHAHEKMALSCIDVIENHAKLLEKATEVPHGQLIRRAPSGSYVYTDESWLRYVVWKERGSTSFDYAAAFWVHHVRCSGKEYHGAATAERILRLIDNENLKQVWFPVYFVIHELGDWMGYEAKASGLRLAMILGLGTTTRLLIQSMSIDDYISISKYHASTTRDFLKGSK